MPSSPSPNPDLEMHVVSSQPQTSSTMKISQDAQKSEQEALRLRGGCIPCPNGTNTLFFSNFLSFFYYGRLLMDFGSGILQPVKLYGPPGAGRRLQPRASLVGRFPSNVHTQILAYVAVPDVPAYARCSHATSALVHDDEVWQHRYSHLSLDVPDVDNIVATLEANANSQAAQRRNVLPPTISVDDDFGDFATGMDVVTAAPDEMGDFVGGFDALSMIPQRKSTANSLLPPPTPTFARHPFLTKYVRMHTVLRTLTRCLTSPAHIILSTLSSALASTPLEEAKLLRVLSLFLSPFVQPIRAWASLYTSLRSAMDRFDATLLAAFDVADEKGNEYEMKQAAEASWQVWDRNGEWEMGKVWMEKREIFYKQGTWNPDENFTKDNKLAFDAMDIFMRAVISSIDEHGARAVRIFPPDSLVLLLFAHRLASEVVGDYVASLLVQAREISSSVLLTATAASFRECWKLVDAILLASQQRPDLDLPKTKAEDVIFQMFEVNMDDYLDEEVETLKRSLESICRSWDRDYAKNPASETARFLGSQNPDQVKRNLISSFTDVLLLPVTIVPMTAAAVGGVIMTGGTAAVQGLAMLNPTRWGGANGTDPDVPHGYETQFSENGQVHDLGDPEDDEEDLQIPSSTKPRMVPGQNGTLSASNNMDLLLSLDVALELIHAAREGLKRVEIFAAYPGHYGHRVRDTIEETFVLLLQALGDRHISTGFTKATEQMNAYRPSEHEGTTSVAPLVQFFELVHIGDTIQSMIQVYFDKELGSHIDRTDFFNAVVREKKRFENTLDDAVAGGLNAGTDVLMSQVEHVILVSTKPREYYPPENSPMDLGPTEGCSKAIKCLEMHCKLLKGSTSKEVLEVFYQEVGIRLIVILQKHLKRQIISQQGGFQVIADLNAYHGFISSLKVSSITNDFSHLKMLGHVFVVEDAKDLAQIVRDVTRYGGAYRPEDIYEFIQRRSDWKVIEKTVDKTMYNLSFKEDCIIV